MKRLADMWVEGAPPASLARVLEPASVLYGLGARIKPLLIEHGMWTPRRLERTPVIAVGNITMGGAGKTPTVAWLAERLTEQGRHVAIVTRGYPGFGAGLSRARRSVRVVCDGAGPLMGPEEAGDEPYLLAAMLPHIPLVIAGGRRYLAARLAEESFAPDVILLDDGYQHIQLARDATVLVVDGSRNLREEKVFPAGRLREPLSALRRADAVLINKSDAADAGALEQTAAVLDQYLPTAPRFSGRYELRPLRRFATSANAVKSQAFSGGERLFAFAGIENPRYFRHLLARRHTVAGEMWFPDHYAYDAADLHAVAAAAREEGAAGLVTTAKDAARLAQPGVLPGEWQDAARLEQPGGLPLWVADIDLVVSDSDGLLAWVGRRLESHE